MVSQCSPRGAVCLCLWGRRADLLDEPGDAASRLSPTPVSVARTSDPRLDEDRNRNRSSRCCDGVAGHPWNVTEASQGTDDCTVTDNIASGIPGG